MAFTSQIEVGGGQPTPPPKPEDTPKPPADGTIPETKPTGEKPPETPPAKPTGVDIPDPPKAPAPTDVLARLVRGEAVPADDLKKAGLSDEDVAAYQKSLGIVGQATAQQLYALAGGEEQYATIQRWAATALSADERTAFNKAVKSGDPALASLAVRGLASRYTAENGKTPDLVRGDKTTASTVRPFTSVAEMTTAMGSPKYKNDPAFREDVRNRLRVTDMGRLSA